MIFTHYRMLRDDAKWILVSTVTVQVISQEILDDIKLYSRGSEKKAMS